MGAQFKLVRYFSLASLVAVGVVTVLLGMFYRRIALNDLMEMAESRNVALTLAFANSLGPQFAPFVASASGLSGDELRAHPEIPKLRRAVLAQMKGLEVVKVKVYNLAGLTVFSTEEKQIGEDKSSNPGFLSARSGKTVSDLVHRDTFNAFDRIIENRDLLQTYLPIRYGGPGGSVEAVFELYYDVTPFLQKMGRTQRVVVIGVLLIFTLLYCVLFIIVRRADRIIKSQDHQLKQYLDELKEANETLEQSIQRRMQELLKVNEQLENEVTERKRAEEEIKKHLQRITALREINLATTSTLDFHAVLKLLLEKIDLLLPYSATTVRLFNKESGLLEPIACQNLDEKEWKAEQWRGGRGIPNVVFERKVPWMVSNVQTDPRVQDPEFFRRHGLVSYLGVPLIVKDEVLGVLSFYTREEHRFSDEEVEFLSTLAGQAAIAIHNSQLFEETKDQAVELERANRDLERGEEVQKLLKEISQDITFLDIDSLLKKLTQKVREFVRADISDVRLIEEESRRIVGVSGIDVDRLREGSTGKGRGGSGWIATNRRPLVIPDISKGRDLPMGQTTHRIGIHGYLAVPIFSRAGEVIGILRALTYDPRHFSQQEVDLLQQLASGAAIALENARLLDKTKKQAFELEKANKVKDEFLGFVSHELRTPVNAVVGYAGMVRDGMFGEVSVEQGRVLGKILARSRDLLEMMNGLLEATRIEAGAVKVKTDEIRLCRFLDELRSSYEPPLNKGLTLAWDYLSDLPVVKTDGGKLRHILQNLINNAIKYTDTGEVRLSARVTAGNKQQAKGSLQGEILPAASCPLPASGGRWVEFKVVDTGVGIPKETLPLIFEMFRQVEGSRGGHRGGVGLGLHIVERFTEMLGGEIGVESEPGKGSTFTVTIPLTPHPNLLPQGEKEQFRRSANQLSQRTSS